MAKEVIRLAGLEPLRKLRLRTAGAYRGTVTEPGALVSDGKLIFARDRVAEARRDLAEDVAERSGSGNGVVIPQDVAARVFRELARAASKKAEVLGQMPKPIWIDAAALERVAVLRYGRGGSIRYVLLDAHRLLLLQHLFEPDEVLCEGPCERVLLRRSGRPVAGLTALQVRPDVQP